MEEMEEFFSKLFHDNFDKLVKRVYRIIGDMEMAQDCVQEAFTIALKRPEKIFSHKDPTAWLSKTVFNVAMNELRRWDNSRNVSLEQMGDIFPAESHSDLTELLPDELDEDQKQLIKMRFEYKMSFREIANSLGITEGAARVRFNRLIRKLRKIFSE